MKKYILYLLKSGKRVRIPTTKKTYINPDTGKRLSTSALLNNHRKYINERNYNKRLMKNPIYKQSIYSASFKNQTFGDEYITSVGRFSSSKGRLIERLAINNQEMVIKDLQIELNIRRDIGPDGFEYKNGIGVVRDEQEILQELQGIIQPDAIKHFRRKSSRFIGKLK